VQYKGMRYPCQLNVRRNSIFMLMLNNDSLYNEMSFIIYDSNTEYNLSINDYM
jgi:hypothetical protein